MMPLFIAGLGMGSAIIALFQQSMMMIESKDSGTASGSMQSLQHIAMAVGIGIVGQLFFISLDISTNAQFAFKYCIYYSGFIFLLVFIYLISKKIILRQQVSGGNTSEKGKEA